MGQSIANDVTDAAEAATAISWTGLVGTLPLPLAHLVRRSLNAKSAVERHHCAFYLGEASLKLAAAARVGVWLSTESEPGSKCAAAVAHLAHPSLGHWQNILRTIDRELAGREDSEALPLGSVLGTLGKRNQDKNVAALADAMLRDEIVSKEQASAAKKQGILGLFELLVAYRNAVLGHGAQRVPSFYQEYGGLILNALGPVLTDNVLLGGLSLAIRKEEGWKDLTGLAGLPTQSDQSFSAGDVDKDTLFMLGGPSPVPLHPLVVYQEDERLQREHVGFLNGALMHKRKKSDSSQEVRRVEYLDYMTGEALAGLDCRGAIAGLLARAQGKELSESGLGVSAVRTPVPDESAAAVVLGPGVDFAGFRIVSELGRGGMGVVYEARQESVNRIVALKVLLASVASDHTAKSRFGVEVSALARADHANIVKIVTAGEVGQRSYFAMEYVDGQDLTHTGSVRTSIERARGASSFAEHLALLFAGAAEGIEHLHTQEVVHRDLKPANLVLTEAGDRLVVMDLGLAKLNDASQNLTNSAVSVLGTMRYMAPERFEKNLDDVGHQADVYGLGATIYEVATGHPLFDGDSEARLVQQILNETPTPAHEVSKEVPEPLSRIIAKATSLLPTDRYPSAAALAADLRKFGEGRAIDARQPESSAEPKASAVSKSPPRTKMVAVIFALVALSVVAVGVGAMFFLGTSDSDPARALEVTLNTTTDAATEDRAVEPVPALPEGMALLSSGEFNMGSSSGEIEAVRSLCDGVSRKQKKDCLGYVGNVFPREEREKRKVSISAFFLDTKEVSIGDFDDWVRASEEVVSKKIDGIGTVWSGGRLLLRADKDSTGLQRQRLNRMLALNFVTWDGARMFCEGQVPAKRLPTEAEWEYAARGTQGRVFPWGDTQPSCEGVWFAREEGMVCDGEWTRRPMVVATAPGDETSDGIHDLGGNVREWVQDSFAPYPAQCQRCNDPLVDLGDGSERVARGGDGFIGVPGLRGAARSHHEASTAEKWLGFRCAMNGPETP